jgi:hypothetical protein
VLLSLTFDAPTGHVILPRMERASDPRGPRVWEGRYLALPSFVRVGDVEAAGDGNCVAVTGGDTGGLPARFFTFVAVLVLWVPLYLWWVSRDPDPGTVADA